MTKDKKNNKIGLVELLNKHSRKIKVGVISSVGIAAILGFAVAVNIGEFGNYDSFRPNDMGTYTIGTEFGMLKLEQGDLYKGNYGKGEFYVLDSEIEKRLLHENIWKLEIPNVPYSCFFDKKNITREGFAGSIGGLLKSKSDVNPLAIGGSNQFRLVSYIKKGSMDTADIPFKKLYDFTIESCKGVIGTLDGRYVRKI